MSCERPLLIPNPRYKGLTVGEKIHYARDVFDLDRLPDEEVEVPCGRCRGCEKNMQFQYGMRLQYELLSHPPNTSLFVTLTFDDDHLERFKNDLNKPVLRFLDVLRKRYSKSIRHWFVCEFGTLRGRPHFHGILFNCPPELIRTYTSNKVGFHPILSKLWKCGISFIGYVDIDTCKYVSKYVSKSLNGKYVRPRLISSFGIGMKYIEDNLSFHNDGLGHLQPFVIVGGKPMPLPRYYYNKIFNSDERKRLTKERFLDGKFYWHGRAYDVREDRDRVRGQTYASNLREKLSRKEKYPAKKVKHSLTKLLTEKIKTDFDL